MSWYLNATFPSDRAIKIQRTRVIKFSAVHIYIVVVKAFIHRAFGSTHPAAVCLLLQPGAAPATKTKAHFYTIGRRRNNFKSCIPL